MNHDPEALDVAVYGSHEAARQAQIDGSLNALTGAARERLAGGGLPQQVAATLEYDLVAGGLDDVGATVGLAHALVRLALLPEPAEDGTRQQIRQWVYTDGRGLPHSFENEVLAVRAAMRGTRAELTTPDGDVYEIVRIRRGDRR